VVGVVISTGASFCNGGFFITMEYGLDGWSTILTCLTETGEAPRLMVSVPAENYKSLVIFPL